MYGRNQSIGYLEMNSHCRERGVCGEKLIVVSRFLESLVAGRPPLRMKGTTVAISDRRLQESAVSVKMGTTSWICDEVLPIKVTIRTNALGISCEIAAAEKTALHAAL